jgi:murein DD-endopeptidase MepM/ murein hydrolase activator NlpD
VGADVRLTLAAGVLVSGLCAAGCATAPVPPPTSTIRVVEAEACAPLAWPVDAQLSSPFGRRDGRPHTGIDLAAPEGTAVRAACAGIVRYAGEEQRGYGRLVIVEHTDGLTTYYAHNSAFAVHAGDVVARGDLVAYAGATGHVTAPHVHFEVRRLGAAIDPLPLMAARLDRSPVAPSAPLARDGDPGMGYALGPRTP